MKKKHLTKHCLTSSNLANIPENINQLFLVSVLKELFQIIRNEQLSVLVSTFRIQGTLEHHVIFIFTFSSAGSIIKRPAMITDPLHLRTGFKMNVINSNLPHS